MIPQRIKLKGFLCYNDEQQIDFDSDATLWMLSGLNGSGKSSIFDAVTFALFGHHRGGAQQNQELINKDCDGSVVEFEFRIDKRDFRVKRTLKRDNKGGARGTQQLFHFDPTTNGEGKWLPVEDTGSRDGFNDWICKNIGLNYETFTSSVLLLQGKAEKLLDSKPGGRHDVLASIVDLERYVRLHAKADELRKKLKDEYDRLTDQLAALPEVKPEEVAEAEDRIQEATTARDAARAEVDRLRGLEHQARGWMDLQGRLASAKQRWENANRLLADSAGIERYVERLRELREALPRLKDIFRLRGEIHDADLKTKNLTLDKQKAVDLVALRESSLKQEREKRSTLHNLISTGETQQRELNGKLIVVAAQLGKLEEYERHDAELTHIQGELVSLPSDPATEVLHARQKLDSLVELAQLVPHLARFQSSREELRQALAREKTIGDKKTEVEARGKRASEEVKRIEPLVEAADRATRQASVQVTEAKTLYQQAHDSLNEIATFDVSGRCRHCGQPLTAGHLEEEKRKRTEEVGRADARLKKVNADANTAKNAEKQWREQFAAAQKAHLEARDEYRDCLNQLRQVRDDVARSEGDCLQTYDVLPESYRQRISPSAPLDWTTTEYPSTRDLDALRAEAAGNAAARQRLQAAEKLQQQWNTLKAREAAALMTRARLQGELPVERDSVRQQHNDFTLRRDALDRELASKRRSLAESDKDIERLTRERELAKAKANDCDQQMKVQDLVRQHAGQSVSTNRKALPDSWQSAAETVGLTEWNLFDKERSDLEEAGVEQSGKDLGQARVNLAIFLQDKEDLETQQATFPAEARCDPATIRGQMEQARKVEEARGADLDSARQKLTQLKGDRQRREDLDTKYKSCESKLKEQKILAELLGPHRLQLYLVRHAERQVVEYANAVLDRLSGGQLYLKLSGEANGEGTSAKALELEAYNRGTGEKPINVAFLSGSQKFRVAVSLALGIGQYASRQHRPIESVIIDEGFGCLDSQGRQVMIQELQNLRSQMRCILLVSHQEEFAESFADGYHFELESGATRIRRIQK